MTFFNYRPVSKGVNNLPPLEAESQVYVLFDQYEPFQAPFQTGVWTKPHRTKPHRTKPHPDKTPQDKTPH